MSTATRIGQKPGLADNRRTLTVEEAARELGIGRGLAYEAVRTGALPALRVGRRLLVPVAALDRLLASGGKGGSSPDEPPAA